MGGGLAVSRTFWLTDVDWGVVDFLRPPPERCLPHEQVMFRLFLNPTTLELISVYTHSTSGPIEVSIHSTLEPA